MSDRVLIVFALALLAAGAYLLWLDRGEVDNLHARIDLLEEKISRGNAKPQPRRKAAAE